MRTNFSKYRKPIKKSKSKIPGHDKNRKLKADRKAAARKGVIERAKAFSAEEVRIANELLVEKLSLSGPCSTAAMVDDLIDRKITGDLQKVSNQKYLETLDLIYVASVALGADHNVENWVRNKCEEMRLRLTKKTNLFTIMALSMIDYGRDADGKRDMTKRGLWNRDIHAIEHLRSIGVKPGGIVAHHDEFGGGLDEWEDAWFRRKKAAMTVSKVVEGEVALGEALGAGDKAEESKPEDHCRVESEVEYSTDTIGEDGSSLTSTESDNSSSSLFHAENVHQLDLAEGESAIVLVTNLDGAITLVDHVLIGGAPTPESATSNIWLIIKNMAERARCATRLGELVGA